MNNFSKILETSRNEKDVENNYREYFNIRLKKLHKEYKNVGTITSPYKTDGFIKYKKSIKEPINLLFSKEQIASWIKTAQNMKIGNDNPTEKIICKFLEKFWVKVSNEIILYVGKTEKQINKRVNQYYRTEIGERGPHSGGSWIKTLNFIDECLIFWATCDNPKLTEEKILKYFHNKFSKEKPDKQTDKQEK